MFSGEVQMSTSYGRQISYAAMLVFFMVFAGFGSVGASEPQTVSIVMDHHYPPLSFLDEAGQPQGILIDQWMLWSQKTGVRAEIHLVPWNEALRRMQAGEFDVIDTLFHTEQRARIYDFLPAYQSIAVPLYFDRERFAANDDASPRRGPVGVKSGDSAIDHAQKQGISTLVFFDSYEAIIQAARDRQIPAFVMDAPPARYLLRKYGIQERFRHTEPLYVGASHRAVRKGNAELRSLVQRGFEKLSAQELQEIERKWYGGSMPVKSGTGASGQ